MSNILIIILFILGKEALLRLSLTINSKTNTVKKAPIGSIKARTPFIVPIEPPNKNPINKIMVNNEYLLQGFELHNSKLSIARPKVRKKLVDCALIIIKMIINEKRFSWNFAFNIK